MEQEILFQHRSRISKNTWKITASVDMVTDLQSFQLTQDIQVIKEEEPGENHFRFFPRLLNSLKALFDIVYKRFVH